MSTLDKNDTVATTPAAPAQAPTAPPADPRRALAERFARLPAEKQRGFLQALKAQGIEFADFLHDQIALAIKRTHN